MPQEYFTKDEFISFIESQDKERLIDLRQGYSGASIGSPMVHFGTHRGMNDFTAAITFLKNDSLILVCQEKCCGLEELHYHTRQIKDRIKNYKDLRNTVAYKKFKRNEENPIPPPDLLPPITETPKTTAILSIPLKTLEELEEVLKECAGECSFAECRDFENLKGKRYNLIEGYSCNLIANGSQIYALSIIQDGLGLVVHYQEGNRSEVIYKKILRHLNYNRIEDLRFYRLVPLH